MRFGRQFGTYDGLSRGNLLVTDRGRRPAEAHDGNYSRSGKTGKMRGIEVQTAKEVAGKEGSLDLLRHAGILQKADVFSVEHPEFATTPRPPGERLPWYTHRSTAKPKGEPQPPFIESATRYFSRVYKTRRRFPNCRSERSKSRIRSRRVFWTLWRIALCRDYKARTIVAGNRIAPDTDPHEHGHRQACVSTSRPTSTRLRG